MRYAIFIWYVGFDLSWLDLLRLFLCWLILNRLLWTYLELGLFLNIRQRGVLRGWWFHQGSWEGFFD